ncbi:MAG TPA: 2-oxoacid:acceptor oxidoreductase subunit alpha [Dehalococcoidia bacterium]|nr:2-oxoacid:acceptor oxidoreductase subunit alpha [Dehalococcoidia bacterium]
MADFQIAASGRAGDGSYTAARFFSEVLKDLGAWVSIWREDIYSNIETRPTVFGVRISSQRIYGPNDLWDMLWALDQSAILDDSPDKQGRIPPFPNLREGGFLIYDSSKRLQLVNAGHEVKIESIEGQLREKKVRAFGIPMGEMASGQLESYRVRNTVALGVLAEVLDLPDDAFFTRFAQSFKDQILELNKQAYLLGKQYAKEQGWDEPELRDIFSQVRGSNGATDNRQFILGNEAIAHGALAAGCRFYAGYPITPASEVLEEMAKHMPKFGGAIIQADDEMSASLHVLGASYAGARSMTATSGPGFSLMQEPISASLINETPLTIFLAQRGGPGTGLPTRQGQEDLNMAIFGSHGEGFRIVLAPSHAEEAYYMTPVLFNLTDRYQCLGIFLYDQFLAQSMYTTELLDPSRIVIDRGKLISSEELMEIRERGESYKRYAFTADGLSPRAFPGQPGAIVYANTNEHDEGGYTTEEQVLRYDMMLKRVTKRYHLAAQDPDFPEPESYGDMDGEIGFISFGSTYGPILEAMERLQARGTSCKFLKLRTLWPLQRDVPQIKEFIDSARQVFTVEQNITAQLRGLIQREVCGPLPDKLRSVLRWDGRLITPGYIVDRVLAGGELIGGEA